MVLHFTENFIQAGWGQKGRGATAEKHGGDCFSGQLRGVMLDLGQKGRNINCRFLPVFGMGIEIAVAAFVQAVWNVNI
jgi:hypothetical protein